MDNQRQADEVRILAGFFAGEGCIGIRKSNKKQLSQSLYAEVGNTERFWPDKFQELFGGFVRLSTSKTRKMLPYWHWTAKDANAAKCLQVIYPFLLGEKRQQAEIALRLWAIKEDHMGWYTPAEHAAMKRLRDELAELRCAAAETKRTSVLPLRNDSPILQVIAA